MSVRVCVWCVCEGVCVNVEEQEGEGMVLKYQTAAA